jgi:hypothetical protein
MKMAETLRQNTDRYPHGGTREQINAWLEKEERLTGVPQARVPPLPGAAPANTNSPRRFSSGDLVDPELAKDWRDLPRDAASVRRTLGILGHEEREVWLHKLLVASTRLGGLPADVIIAALQDVHQMQIANLMQDNGELQEEIRNHKAARDRAEKEVIDGLADNLFEFTKNLVLHEVKERVARLQQRVLAKSAQISNEGKAIAELHAKAVLIAGRVDYLESTNPIWVAVNTGGD